MSQVRVDCKAHRTGPRGIKLDIKVDDRPRFGKMHCELKFSDLQSDKLDYVLEKRSVMAEESLDGRDVSDAEGIQGYLAAAIEQLQGLIEDIIAAAYTE